VGKLAQRLGGLLPDAAAQKVQETVGIDRLTALESAFELVRRGGTVSVSGVYGGAASPMNLMQIFDKQIQIRGGQANVKRWIGEIMPLLTGEGDPLGTESFATHHVPLDDAPEAYKNFQTKADGTFKVVFKPGI
jgi:threonine dehydrogenase-like Zn-dependent dehydrogenase